MRADAASLAVQAADFDTALKQYAEARTWQNS
jgi:hypothetical protein